jgi:predicted peroxiredoxin
MSEERILSASRIKTYEGCSWEYWCNYHLKLPSESNDGARRGSVCHLIFELLLHEKWKKYYDQIIDANSVWVVPSIKRLIYKTARAEKMTETSDNYDLCNEMILVGLKTDFFCTEGGGKLLKPEYEFNLKNENPKYSVRGFVDKASKNGKRLMICDYKTSARKFEGEEIEFNIQAMVYSLVGLKEDPECEPEAKFLFVKLPDPVVSIKYSKEELEGFEYYLAEVYEKINNFTEISAKANFAKKQPFPKKGQGFKGPLKCAMYCHKPGQKKKNGDIMWHCPFKFPYDYYATEKDGKVVETALNKKDLKKAGKVVQKHYSGCPAFPEFQE